MNQVTAPSSSADFLAGLFGLDGRVAVVTGGTSGLGAAVAEGLARAGATVIALGRDERRGLEVVDRIRGSGGSAHLELADVTSAGDIERVAAAVHAAHPRVDILVNAAGVDAGGGPAADASLDEWQRVFDVNVTGTMRLCQAFGRRMIAQGRGCIVNFASSDGLVGVPEATAYTASKGAVIQLTRSLAAEWIRHGVRVNAIAPTEFATPMIAGLRAAPGYQEWVERVVPIGRIGEPHELVGALLLLVSDGAGMVVGHTLVIDGGRTII